MLVEVGPPSLHRDEQLADLSLAKQLAPVESDIRPSRLRIIRDDTAKRVDVAPAVGSVPLGDGKFQEINLVPLEDVLLHRPAVDHFRPDRVAIGLVQVSDQVLLAGLRRQAKHQRDLGPAREPACHEFGAAALLVVLDVLEQECRPVKAVVHPRDTAELLVPGHLFLDPKELACFFELGEPASKAWLVR